MFNKFIAGKISLNEYVHRIKNNGATFYVNYWGAILKHYDNLPHKHSFFEICYVLDGHGIYMEGDCAYPIQKNTMFFSRPDVTHQIQSENGLSLVYVGFDLIESESSKEWIHKIKEAKQCSEFIIDIDKDEALPMIWKSLLLQAAKAEHTFFKEILENLASSLILLIVETFVPRIEYHNDKSIHKKSCIILNQAKLLIKDNLASSLKLTELAAHLHISSRHLSRLFASELGVSYTEYIQNERIQKAAMLLKTTDLSIKDIAEETGFSNIHYFTRVFHSAMDCSPGRFRTLYTKLKTITYKD
ncbi:helix-turn-helix domain-containing protein [Niallia nealsonii]|uniref:AraC family transcriptional regulator n=1 Tax=Niallia nealsonii TaxID=115979 RepID=A0A2N0YWW5_9BACI|nr:helix-turn-helix domain-containing protein [Niallia nealsonii]PKG21744.1 AraC family transcriptional regulator [Niallia nealsonii]